MEYSRYRYGWYVPSVSFSHVRLPPLRYVSAMPLAMRYAGVGSSMDVSVCGATVTKPPCIASMSACDRSSHHTYESPAQHEGLYRATEISLTSRPDSHCERARPRSASILAAHPALS